MPPAVGGDVAYGGTESGEIDAFALDGCGADTCSALTTVDTGSAITGGPIVDDGRVFAVLALSGAAVVVAGLWLAPIGRLVAERRAAVRTALAVVAAGVREGDRLPPAGGVAFLGACVLFLLAPPRR